MNRSDKIKLRNKKTGKVKEFDMLGCFMLSDDFPNLYTEDKIYNSLAEFNEEWEDYKEPLIKDEKIRKAVRAWAEACGVNRVVNGEYDNELCAKGQQFYGAKIVLTKTVALPRGRNYTITELCGEEEE